LHWKKVRSISRRNRVVAPFFFFYTKRGSRGTSLDLAGKHANELFDEQDDWVRPEGHVARPPRAQDHLKLDSDHDQRNNPRFQYFHSTIELPHDVVAHEMCKVTTALYEQISS
jgi:hypothetical protein